MPIKFRCPQCKQFLGISRSKAGTVTDCPTCGRALRVPNLDGSVLPLPKAELNLQDTGLVNALEALARLNANESHESADAVRSEPESAGPAVVVSVDDAGPVPLPEPVEVEPPLPAEIVVSPAPPKTDDDSRGDGVDPLEDLARAASRAPQRDSPSGGRPRTWPPATLFALFAGGLLLFASGFFLGRAGSNPLNANGSDIDQAPASSALVPANESRPPLPLENLSGFSPALTGRILYVTADGVPRPDDGARIIVLPEQRQGDHKLSVVGFRSGASAADQQFARSALREAGGDFAVADADGRYTIQLPAAEKYHVLLISRHQPRDEGEFLRPGLQRILEDYFDRPTGLIGSVAYELSDFRYRGGPPAPRDHTFSR
ncbi:MAG: hypothetical protein DWQ34_24955 [Planctomycetota bacterium]|nr:MAG: hypothetical protein DWQ34_24955 [Planctomycetota bacterium]REK24438.1 MAG: hypothetical protein DWQ41_15595 [Planctomycetota bacterium]REK38627.1 MAG: hypothetical protein DWQ45_04380 [Planctomycetota bacterium]